MKQKIVLLATSLMAAWSLVACSDQSQAPSTELSQADGSTNYYYSNSVNSTAKVKYMREIATIGGEEADYVYVWREHRPISTEVTNSFWTLEKKDNVIVQTQKICNAQYPFLRGVEQTNYYMAVDDLNDPTNLKDIRTINTHILLLKTNKVCGYEVFNFCTKIAEQLANAGKANHLVACDNNSKLPGNNMKLTLGQLLEVLDGPRHLTPDVDYLTIGVYVTIDELLKVNSQAKSDGSISADGISPALLRAAAHEIYN